MAGRWAFEGWVYRDGAGRRVGPVSTEQLRQLLARGEVRATDTVWRQWARAGTLLLPALAKEVLHPNQPSKPF
jgi:GYF domain 2